MKSNTAEQGEEYYKCVGRKKIECVKKFLDPHVEFYGPLATLQGKEAVVQATSNFMNTFRSLIIRARFGSDNQAMIVYDVDIPGIMENFPGASLLTFQGDLITRIELFYDSSRLAKKKEEIFSKS